MQKFAMIVTKHDGAEVHVFGTAGSPAQKGCENIRDTWRADLAAEPRRYYTLNDPEGEPINVGVRDIADVRIVVGSAY